MGQEHPLLAVIGAELEEVDAAALDDLLGLDAAEAHGAEGHGGAVEEVRPRPFHHGPWMVSMRVMLPVALFALAMTVTAITCTWWPLARKYQTTEHKVAVVLGMICLSGVALVSLLVTGVAGGCAAMGK